MRSTIRRLVGALLLALLTVAVGVEVVPQSLSAEATSDDAKTKGKGKGKNKAKEAATTKPATGPLNAEEKTILKLMTHPGCFTGNSDTGEKVNVPYPKLSREERGKLLLDQYRAGGRGKNVATTMYAVDAMVDIYNGEAGKYAELYAKFPQQLRRAALEATGMALTGEKMAGPFSLKFQEENEPLLGFVDNLRRIKAREGVAQLHLAISCNMAVASIEKDWMPFHKSEVDLPKDRFQIAKGPGGQHLDIRYKGEKTLTNVVLFSLVRQNPKGPKNKNQVPLEAIDAFNRAFGSTQQQADDALTILRSEEIHSRMPKYAMLYLPEWTPNLDVRFEVGYMERGDALKGNTNTLAIYSDQGFVVSPDLLGFPAKPEPKQKK